MRIVGSKFHDYYDGVMAHGGHDDSLTFVRTQREASDLGLQFPKLEFEYLPADKRVFYGTHGAIGFCGKLYPYVVMRRGQTFDPVASKTYGATVYTPKEEIWCYTPAQWNEFFATYPRLENADRLQRRSSRIYLHSDSHTRWNLTPASDICAVGEWFTPKENLTVFFAANAPILIPTENDDRSYVVIVNGRLKNYGFERCFGAYEAFQEISMFIGGVLPNAGREMVELADTDKRDKHGFDKMSFKTYSPGKKSKRRL